MSERKYFGTDGVRAVAGQFPLTAEWTLRLGQASAEVLKRTTGKPTVVIGRDTRQSGAMLEAALTAGLTAQGVDVIHLGVIPTPGVSYLTRRIGASAGIVISASHNPFEDNGIKFFSATGEKLPDALEHEIENALTATPSSNTSSTSTGISSTGTSRTIGSVSEDPEATRTYRQFLLELAPDLSGLRIALDCANGATHLIAPDVFQQAGADVCAIFTSPNGRNINRDCGSTHPAMLQKIVREGGFDLGIAFDGDGDRAIFVDSSGELFHGDHMLYATALTRGEKRVVTTIMANMGLEVKLAEHNIALERTAVGDRYVHERLLEQGLRLGGEQSGHVLFLDLAPTGDGILTALETLRAVIKSGKTLMEWRTDLPMFPQVLKNVRIPAKFDKHKLVNHELVLQTLEQATLQLSGRGRINLRPSGTEPIVRVMVEGPSETEINAVAEMLSQVLEAAAR